MPWVTQLESFKIARPFVFRFDPTFYHQCCVHGGLVDGGAVGFWGVLVLGSIEQLTQGYNGSRATG